MRWGLVSFWADHSSVTLQQSMRCDALVRGEGERVSQIPNVSARGNALGSLLILYGIRLLEKSAGWGC